MHLVELVIVACLLKDPAHCESFRLPFQTEMNIVECVWGSQLHAAEWAGRHPAWRVKRFTCEMPKA